MRFPSWNTTSFMGLYTSSTSWVYTLQALHGCVNEIPIMEHYHLLGSIHYQLLGSIHYQLHGSIHYQLLGSIHYQLHGSIHYHLLGSVYYIL